MPRPVKCETVYEGEWFEHRSKMLQDADFALLGVDSLRGKIAYFGFWDNYL